MSLSQNTFSELKESVHHGPALRLVIEIVDSFELKLQQNGYQNPEFIELLSQILGLCTELCTNTRVVQQRSAVTLLDLVLRSLSRYLPQNTSSSTSSKYSDVQAGVQEVMRERLLNSDFRDSQAVGNGLLRIEDFEILDVIDLGPILGAHDSDAKKPSKKFTVRAKLAAADRALLETNRMYEALTSNTATVRRPRPSRHGIDNEKDLLADNEEADEVELLGREEALLDVAPLDYFSGMKRTEFSTSTYEVAARLADATTSACPLEEDIEGQTRAAVSLTELGEISVTEKDITPQVTQAKPESDSHSKRTITDEQFSSRELNRAQNVLRKLLPGAIPSTNSPSSSYYRIDFTLPSLQQIAHLLQRFYLQLSQYLLHPSWHIRYSACLTMLQLIPHFSLLGTKTKTSAHFAQDLACRLLSLLALDRYTDFAPQFPTSGTAAAVPRTASGSRPAADPTPQDSKESGSSKAIHPEAFSFHSDVRRSSQHVRSTIPVPGAPSIHSPVRVVAALCFSTVLGEWSSGSTAAHEDLSMHSLSEQVQQLVTELASSESWQTRYGAILVVSAHLRTRRFFYAPVRDDASAQGAGSSQAGLLLRFCFDSAPDIARTALRTCIALFHDAYLQSITTTTPIDFRDNQLLRYLTPERCKLYLARTLFILQRMPAISSYTRSSIDSASHAPNADTSSEPAENKPEYGTVSSLFLEYYVFSRWLSWTLEYQHATSPDIATSTSSMDSHITWLPFLPILVNTYVRYAIHPSVQRFYTWCSNYERYGNQDKPVVAPSDENIRNSTGVASVQIIDMYQTLYENMESGELEWSDEVKNDCYLLTQTPLSILSSSSSFAPSQLCPPCPAMVRFGPLLHILRLIATTLMSPSSVSPPIFTAFREWVALALFPTLLQLLFMVLPDCSAFMQSTESLSPIMDSLECGYIDQLLSTAGTSNGSDLNKAPSQCMFSISTSNFNNHCSQCVATPSNAETFCSRHRAFLDTLQSNVDILSAMDPIDDPIIWHATLFQTLVSLFIIASTTTHSTESIAASIAAIPRDCTWDWIFHAVHTLLIPYRDLVQYPPIAMESVPAGAILDHTTKKSFGISSIEENGYAGESDGVSAVFRAFGSHQYYDMKSENEDVIQNAAAATKSLGSNQHEMDNRREMDYPKGYSIYFSHQSSVWSNINSSVYSLPPNTLPFERIQLSLCPLFPFALLGHAVVTDDNKDLGDPLDALFPNPVYSGCIASTELNAASSDFLIRAQTSIQQSICGFLSRGLGATESKDLLLEKSLDLDTLETHEYQHIPVQYATDVGEIDYTKKIGVLTMEVMKKKGPQKAKRGRPASENEGRSVGFRSKRAPRGRNKGLELERSNPAADASDSATIPRRSSRLRPLPRVDYSESVNAKAPLAIPLDMNISEAFETGEEDIRQLLGGSLRSPFCEVFSPEPLPSIRPKWKYNTAPTQFVVHMSLCENGLYYSVFPSPVVYSPVSVRLECASSPELQQLSVRYLSFVLLMMATFGQKSPSGNTNGAPTNTDPTSSNTSTNSKPCSFPTPLLQTLIPTWYMLFQQYFFTHTSTQQSISVHSEGTSSLPPLEFSSVHPLSSRIPSLSCAPHAATTSFALDSFGSLLNTLESITSAANSNRDELANLHPWTSAYLIATEATRKHLLHVWGRPFLFDYASSNPSDTFASYAFNSLSIEPQPVRIEVEEVLSAVWDTIRWFQEISPWQRVHIFGMILYPDLYSFEYESSTGGSEECNPQYLTLPLSVPFAPLYFDSSLFLDLFAMSMDAIRKSSGEDMEEIGKQGMTKDSKKNKRLRSDGSTKARSVSSSHTSTDQGGTEDGGNLQSKWRERLESFFNQQNRYFAKERPLAQNVLPNGPVDVESTCNAYWSLAEVDDSASEFTLLPSFLVHLLSTLYFTLWCLSPYLDILSTYPYQDYAVKGIPFLQSIAEKVLSRVSRDEALASHSVVAYFCRNCCSMKDTPVPTSQQRPDQRPPLCICGYLSQSSKNVSRSGRSSSRRFNNPTKGRPNTDASISALSMDVTNLQRSEEMESKADAYLGSAMYTLSRACAKIQQLEKIWVVASSSVLFPILHLELLGARQTNPCISYSQHKLQSSVWHNTSVLVKALSRLVGRCIRSYEQLHFVTETTSFSFEKALFRTVPTQITMREWSNVFATWANDAHDNVSLASFQSKLSLLSKVSTLPMATTETVAGACSAPGLAEQGFLMRYFSSFLTAVLSSLIGESRRCALSLKVDITGECRADRHTDSKVLTEPSRNRAEEIGRMLVRLVKRINKETLYYSNEGASTFPPILSFLSPLVSTNQSSLLHLIFPLLFSGGKQGAKTEPLLDIKRLAKAPMTYSISLGNMPHSRRDVFRTLELCFSNILSSSTNSVSSVYGKGPNPTLPSLLDSLTAAFTTIPILRDIQAIFLDNASYTIPFVCDNSFPAAETPTATETVETAENPSSTAPIPVPLQISLLPSHLRMLFPILGTYFSSRPAAPFLLDSELPCMAALFDLRGITSVSPCTIAYVQCHQLEGLVPVEYNADFYVATTNNLFEGLLVKNPLPFLQYYSLVMLQLHQHTLMSEFESGSGAFHLSPAIQFKFVRIEDTRIEPPRIITPLTCPQSGPGCMRTPIIDFPHALRSCFSLATVVIGILERAQLIKAIQSQYSQFSSFERLESPLEPESKERPSEKLPMTLQLSSKVDEECGLRVDAYRREVPLASNDVLFFLIYLPLFLPTITKHRGVLHFSHVTAPLLNSILHLLTIQPHLIRYLESEHSIVAELRHLFSDCSPCTFHTSSLSGVLHGHLFSTTLVLTFPDSFLPSFSPSINNTARDLFTSVRGAYVKDNVLRVLLPPSRKLLLSFTMSQWDAFSQSIRTLRMLLQFQQTHLQSLSTFTLDAIATARGATAFLLPSSPPSPSLPLATPSPNAANIPVTTDQAPDRPQKAPPSDTLPLSPVHCLYTQYPLRPYQLHCVHWAARLRSIGLNGLCADDMGLGKTVEALAVLTQSLAEEKTADRMCKKTRQGVAEPAVDVVQESLPRIIERSVSIVVAPKSVLYHWQGEIRQFQLFSTNTERFHPLPSLPFQDKDLAEETKFFESKAFPLRVDTIDTSSIPSATLYLRYIPVVYSGSPRTRHRLFNSLLDILCSNAPVVESNTLSVHSTNTATPIRYVDHYVLIVPYSLLQQDISVLASAVYHHTIFDEAHMLCGPQSLAERPVLSHSTPNIVTLSTHSTTQELMRPTTRQSLFQAAQVLSAISRLRLCLTGTPVTGRVGDIWTLMQVLNPGYLGSHETFHAKYVIDVERARTWTGSSKGAEVVFYKARRALGDLHAAILFLVLRRTRFDVLKDLPPISVVDMKLNMAPVHHLLYSLFAQTTNALWTLAPMSAAAETPTASPSFSDATADTEPPKLTQTQLFSTSDPSSLLSLSSSLASPSDDAITDEAFTFPSITATNNADTSTTTNAGIPASLSLRLPKGYTSRYWDLNALTALRHARQLSTHPVLLDAEMKEFLLQELDRLCELGFVHWKGTTEVEKEKVEVEEIADSTLASSTPPVQTPPIAYTHIPQDLYRSILRLFGAPTTVSQGGGSLSFPLVPDTASAPMLGVCKLEAIHQLLLSCGYTNASANRSSSFSTASFTQSPDSFPPKIVFFAQSLQSLETLLHAVLIPNFPAFRPLILHAGLSARARNDLVQEFSRDPRTRFLLTTTRVGGLGLTLVSASVVVFLESDWDPYRDRQAMDRVHRLGQKRPVTVYRLWTRGTVEDKIWAMQRWKVGVANAIVSGSARSEAVALQRRKRNREGERDEREGRGDLDLEGSEDSEDKKAESKKAAIEERGESNANMEQGVSGNGDVMEEASDDEALLQELELELSAMQRSMPLTDT